jgi:STE24 endopeptidase
MLHGFRAPTVFTASDVIDDLTEDELAALLAHEGAHIYLNHLWIKGAITMGLGICVVFAVIMGVQRFQESLSVPALGGLVLAIILGKLSLFNAISRRQEREADAFAAQTVGPDALISALEKIMPPALLAKNVADLTLWSTHDSWPRRRQRILELSERSTCA